jgi:hypothetical protein
MTDDQPKKRTSETCKQEFLSLSTKLGALEYDKKVGLNKFSQQKEELLAKMVSLEAEYKGLMEQEKLTAEMESQIG